MGMPMTPDPATHTVTYRNARGERRYQPALPTGETLWWQQGLFPFGPGKLVWRSADHLVSTSLDQPILYRYSHEAAEAAVLESGFTPVTSAHGLYVEWRNTYGKVRYQPRLADGRTLHTGIYVPGRFWDHDADGYGTPALYESRRRAISLARAGRLEQRLAARAGDTADRGFAREWDDAPDADEAAFHDRYSAGGRP